MHVNGSINYGSGEGFRYWLRTRLPRAIDRRLRLGEIRAALARHDHALISFPKTGRTWLRVMLCDVLREKHALPDSDAFRAGKIADMVAGVQGAPRIWVSHDDDPQWREERHLHHDKSAYRGHRVCFLVRDPRDVIVSLFFQKTKRRGVPLANARELLYHQVGGLRSLVAFYNIWWRARTVAGGFHLVRYEDMRRDAAGELAKVCDFLGFGALPDGAIGRAVEAASFERMRQAEQSGERSGHLFKPGDKSDVQSYKTREGKIGGYRTHFSDEDIRWMDAHIAEHLDPAFGYSVPRPAPPVPASADAPPAFAGAQTA